MDPHEEMAAHSSILVWRILWTEEPGGLQSMGSQRVRHAAAAAAKSLQSCPTLCYPVDGSPPASPVPGIFQYPCLENPMDRGAWWATVHGIAKSWT